MYEEELAFAVELADRAGELALSHFGRELHVREKADRSPVTEADLAIEAMVRLALADRYPRDAVLGEEEGLQGEGADGRCWIVDPIDGTKNFADGVPVWGNLIALSVHNEPVVGIANAPAIGERYVAAQGAGATCNGSAIRVSRADRVSRAFVVYSSIDDWLLGPYRRPAQELLLDARRNRGFGDFWGHMLVARGAADVMFESELAVWDWAALAIIVREAGGRITTFEGGPLAHDGAVLTTNGVLHDEILARLASGVERTGPEIVPES